MTPEERDRIKYKILPHSNASQICEGTFVAGVTFKEVEERCKGSWGGRMQRFESTLEGGTFTYIAYTD